MQRNEQTAPAPQGETDAAHDRTSLPSLDQIIEREARYRSAIERALGPGYLDAPPPCNGCGLVAYWSGRCTVGGKPELCEQWLADVREEAARGASL